MAETQLNLAAILARLPSNVTPLATPPELWPRIAAAHAARQQRRRRLRNGAALCAVAMFALGTGAFVWRAAHSPTIDWQARAQALELQLDALPLPAAGDLTAQPSVGELSRIDQALQAAYDNGARASEITPLWQRRSELLETLLLVRRQQSLPAQT